MMHDLGIALRARLAVQSCPLPVVDGPEEFDAAVTYAPSRIVIEHDDQDAFVNGRGVRANPARAAWFRKVGGKITIYGQSPRPAAVPFEHRLYVDRVLDLVVTSLDEAVRGTLRCNLEISSGGFEPLADLEGSKRAAGAKYVLRFAVERGVATKTWAGAARPEAEIGGADGITIGSTTRVSLNGDDDDAETSCGG